MGETTVRLVDDSGSAAGYLRLPERTWWSTLDPEARLVVAAGALCAGLAVVILASPLEVVGRYLATLFVYGVLTSALLPTPIEFMLVKTPANPYATVLVASLGKTLGSLLVFLVGVNLGEGLKRLLSKESISKRMFDATERLAKRHGYAALYAVLAVPFMADTVVLYVFSALRMNRNVFLATVFLASLVRTGLIVFGVGPGVSYLYATVAGG